MKNIKFVSSAGILFTLAMTCFGQNPFVTHIYTADPTARVFNDTLYVYPSHDIECEEGYGENNFCMEDYHVFSTTDLQEWTDHGVIVTQYDAEWIKPASFSLWAPDCIEKDGKYYFYFPAKPADESAFMRIGVAVADHPSGPFKVRQEYIKGVKGIDPGLFVDDDGLAYLYHGGGKEMNVARLCDDMVSIVGEAEVVRELPAEGYKEGSFLFKRGEIYYFTFPHDPSGSEEIAYATGDNPMGPFEYQGIIMDRWKDGCWTNHHSITEYKGDWYIFYHHHDLSGDQTLRSIRVDRLHFNEDGSIQKVIPTDHGPLSGPPRPPDGFKWVPNEKFSDEFNGAGLDASKWHARSPYWVHGRAPATFRDYSVSVKNDLMQIKNSVLEGDERYNIAGGAVASVAMDAFFGYYEVRMKASSISMSSTFWMKNKPNEGDCPYDRQELDIVEAVGMQKTGWDFRNFMKSNTHYGRINCEGERESKSAGGNCEISPAANEAYHVYGCWWVDANTIKFYHNGEYKFTIHPNTELNDKPFNRPMYMHMVTETYNWESPPTVEELNNDDINTTFYDWVRSYKLVPVD